MKPDIKYDGYENYTLRYCPMHKLTKKGNVKRGCSFWYILYRGRVIDMALTLAAARRRIRITRQSVLI